MFFVLCPFFSTLLVSWFLLEAKPPERGICPSALSVGNWDFIGWERWRLIVVRPPFPEERGFVFRIFGGRPNPGYKGRWLRNRCACEWSWVWSARARVCVCEREWPWVWSMCVCVTLSLKRVVCVCARARAGGGILKTERRGRKPGGCWWASIASLPGHCRPLSWPFSLLKRGTLGDTRWERRKLLASGLLHVRPSWSLTSFPLRFSSQYIY